MKLTIAKDKVTDNLEVNLKIAENQEEFQTLSCNYDKGVVAFAFELDEEDLANLQKEKRIYILLLTGGNPMQPINIAVDQKDFEEMVDYSREQMTPAEEGSQ